MWYKIQVSHTVQISRYTAFQTLVSDSFWMNIECGLIGCIVCFEWEVVRQNASNTFCPKNIFSRYTEFKPWYLLVLKFIEWCLIGCRVWKYSNLTLHPIKPHSIFIQKRIDIRAETWCTLENAIFLDSMCYLHFVSHNLSFPTLCILSNHTLYSFKKRTCIRAETQCTRKMFFL